MKTYGKIELFTDAQGKELFIDILKLPYNNFEIVFNDLDINVPPSIWAYSKIITYSLQKEPYIHIDGDVYLWKKLPQEYLTAPVFFQHIENETNCDYPKVYAYPKKIITDNFKITPSCWKAGYRKAYNCGIVGVNDLSAMKYYTDQVTQCIEAPLNQNVLKEFNKNEKKHTLWSFNCVFEQFTAYSALNEYGIEPLCLFTAENIIDDTRCLELGYTHVLGVKHEPYTPDCELERLERRVMREYPEQYERLIYYLNIPKKLGPIKTKENTNYSPNIQLETSIEW